MILAIASYIAVYISFILIDVLYIIALIAAIVYAIIDGYAKPDSSKMKKISQYAFILYSLGFAIAPSISNSSLVMIGVLGYRIVLHIGFSEIFPGITEILLGYPIRVYFELLGLLIILKLFLFDIVLLSWYAFYDQILSRIRSSIHAAKNSSFKRMHFTLTSMFFTRDVFTLLLFVAQALLYVFDITWILLLVFIAWIIVFFFTQIGAHIWMRAHLPKDDDELKKVKKKVCELSLEKLKFCRLPLLFTSCGDVMQSFLGYFLLSSF